MSEHDEQSDRQRERDAASDKRDDASSRRDEIAARRDEASERRRDRDDNVLVAITELTTKVGDMNLSFREKFLENKEWQAIADKRLSSHSTKINWMIGLGSGVTAVFGFIKAWMGLTGK